LYYFLLTIHSLTPNLIIYSSVSVLRFWNDINVKGIVHRSQGSGGRAQVLTAVQGEGISCRKCL